MLGLRKAGGCWLLGFLKRGPQVFGSLGSWVDVGGLATHFGQKLEEFFAKRV